MTPSARLSAAIEVLADIEGRRRPASDALKDWGLAHRFAGSKDRAAIASLAYDALRRKASGAWIMGADNPRAVLLGMLRLVRGGSAESLDALFSGERFAPEPLTAQERARLSTASLDGAPAHVAGDFPEWLTPSLMRAFGDELVPETQALATRAPLDIRVNTLKVSRAAAKADLAHLSPAETPFAPTGLRLPVGEEGRGPSLQAEAGFPQGWFEVQDEGSQIAAMLVGARPGETIVDLCAGAGGKTLALAASMENEGRIVATDVDGRRLAPIYARIQRSGATNIEVRSPKGRWRPDGPDPLADLAGNVDCVLVDAPCTGTGTWRRNPDAKWRLRPGSLAERIKEQAAVLDRAAALLKPGGRLIYVTCSVLPEENGEAVAGCLARHPGVELLRPEFVAPVASLTLTGVLGLSGIQLSPLRTGTDGFYVAQLLYGPRSRRHG